MNVKEAFVAIFSAFATVAVIFSLGQCSVHLNDSHYRASVDKEKACVSQHMQWHANSEDCTR